MMPLKEYYHEQLRTGYDDLMGPNPRQQPTYEFFRRKLNGKYPTITLDAAAFGRTLDSWQDEMDVANAPQLGH